MRRFRSPVLKVINHLLKWPFSLPEGWYAVSKLLFLLSLSCCPYR